MLQSMGSQRGGHDLVTKHKVAYPVPSSHVSPDHQLGQQSRGSYQVTGGAGRLFQIEKAGRSCVAMTLRQRHERNGKVSLPR